MSSDAASTQITTLSLHDALPISTLNFLPVWFALSLLRFRLPSRLPMMFILWMVGTRSEERFSRNAETDVVCRLLLEKIKQIYGAFLDVQAAAGASVVQLFDYVIG